MNQIITDNLQEIQAICEQFGVARLELFGSAARDDFDPETSDAKAGTARACRERKHGYLTCASTSSK